MILSTYHPIVLLTYLKFQVEAAGNYIVSFVIMFHYLQDISINSATESKSCNLLFPGYSLITNKGYCRHVKGGGYPSFCLSQTTSTVTSCESYCTNQKSCVGYNYNAKSTECILFTNDSTCPSLFFQDFRSSRETNTAKTMNDLRPVSHSNFDSVCYGRYPGKIIHRF